MCGRYVAPDIAAIERQWQLGPQQVPELGLRYNVAPAAEVPMLWRDQGVLKLGVARWGLVPHWWSQPRAPRFNHNARIEEAATKPMWRDSLRRWRCILPAAGWYEWRESDKQPFYFHRRDGRLSALAGILAFREGQVTCAVLSSAAGGGLEAVHARMPLCLSPEGESAWLDSGTVHAQPAAVAYHPVRRLVNSSRAEGPELLEPAWPKERHP